MIWHWEGELSSLDFYKFFYKKSCMNKNDQWNFDRVENALAMAEKARQIDPTNTDVSAMLNSVRSVSRARAQGNELFKSGYFAEACMAYGEGLKYDPSNSVLHCNRAACRSKLGQWEKSVEDCNEALRIHPSYTKALLRRAASYVKVKCLFLCSSCPLSTMSCVIRIPRTLWIDLFNVSHWVDSLSAGLKLCEIMKP